MAERMKNVTQPQLKQLYIGLMRKSLPQVPALDHNILSEHQYLLRLC